MTEILSLYVTFQARYVGANEQIRGPKLDMICNNVWLKINTYVGPEYAQIIMVLLRTNPRAHDGSVPTKTCEKKGAVDPKPAAPKYNTQCVLLSKLFDAVDELIKRQQPQHLPKAITMLLAVMFYKLWFLMMDKESNQTTHNDNAKLVLKNLGRLPHMKDKNFDKKLIGFAGLVDGRVAQCMRFHFGKYAQAE